MPEAEEEPTRYILRMTEEARRQIDTEYWRINDAVGQRVADEWKTGLLQAIGALNLFPTGYPVAAESAVMPEGIIVRQMVYRRRRGRNAPAHRVLFRVEDRDEAARGGDIPAVYVLYVKHGAAARPGDPGTDEEMTGGQAG